MLILKTSMAGTVPTYNEQRMFWIQTICAIVLLKQNIIEKISLTALNNAYFENKCDW